MTDQPFTVREIQVAVWRFCLGRGVRIVVPNVAFYQGEQDAIAITRAGYVEEFEIKLSRADFLADFRKDWSYYHRGERGQLGHRVQVTKHDVLSGKVQTSQRRPRRFWFVVPVGLVALEDVPEYAGLLLACRADRSSTAYLRFSRQAPNLSGSAKVTAKEYFTLLKSASFKLMERIASYRSAP